MKQMEIKKEDIEKFNRLSSQMNSLISDIKQYCKEAYIYVSEGEINLMNAPCHELYDTTLQSNVVSTVHIMTLFGGESRT